MTVINQEAASKRFYQGLLYLLGMSNGGKANCWYFRNGRGRNWKMPDRRSEAIRGRIWKDAGFADTDDGDLDSDVAGDHALMDDVVSRWTVARQRAAKTEMGRRR